MDPWAFFDLPAHADKPMLKRAYAQKLKAMNPEDDPEGFQILRLAFEAALELLAQPPFSSAKKPSGSPTGSSPVSVCQSGIASGQEPNAPTVHPSTIEKRKVKAGDKQESLDFNEETQNQELNPEADALPHQNLAHVPSNREVEEASKVACPVLADSPGPLPSNPKDTAELLKVSEALSVYLARAKQGGGEEALEELSRWLATGNPSRRQAWNQLLFKTVVAGQISRPMLLPLFWAFYIRDHAFHFEVEGTELTKHRFQKIVQQTLQEDFWNIRADFAKSVADGKTTEALENLENVLATPAFDHLLRRQMLRIVMLRFIAKNPHVPNEVLRGLDKVFQFSNFLGQYSPEEAKLSHHLQNRLYLANPMSSPEFQKQGAPRPNQAIKFGTVSIVTLLLLFLLGFAYLLF